MFRFSLAAALVMVAGPLATASAQENTAPACSNGADDDRDGAPDCSDLECRYFVFCAQAQPNVQIAPQPIAGPSAQGYEGTYARAREAWYRQNYGYVPSGASPGYGPTPSYGATHPAWGIVGVGLATFAAFWVADFAVSAPTQGGAPNGGASIALSFVPLAGPFIQLPFSTTGLFTALLVTFGVGQVTGLVLAIVGLALQEPDGPGYASGDALPFALAPWVSHEGGGLTGSLRF